MKVSYGAISTAAWQRKRTTANARYGDAQIDNIPTYDMVHIHS
jgi:hypothetical protein